MRIEISKKSITLLIATAVGLVLLWRLQTLLLSFILAYILVCGLRPLAIKISSACRLNYKLAASLVFAATLLTFLATAESFASLLISQLGSFTQNLPVLVSAFLAKLQGFGVDINQTQINSFVTIALNKIADNLARGTFGTISVFLFTTIFFVFTFYLLVNYDEAVNWFAGLSPKSSKRIKSLEKKIREGVGGWVTGQILLALLVGIVTFFGLLLLRVNYPLALTFLATILSPIAGIGPLIALIPAVIIATLQRPILGLWVFFFYNVIQMVKDDLIVPKLMGNILGLDAVEILLVLIIGGSLFGILGVIVSVPTAVGIKVIFENLRES